MTVQELIIELSKFPADIEVCSISDSTWKPVRKVTLSKDYWGKDYIQINSSPS